MPHTAESFNWPEYNPAWAVIKVAPTPWAVILLAWLIVLISAAVGFEVPASGSALVCGALISEAALERLRWRTLPTDPSGRVSLTPDSSDRKPLLGNEYMMAPAGQGRLGALLSLALEHEVKLNAEDGKSYWYYKDTVVRVDRMIYAAIIVTAVAGTVLWAYGHLVY